jgi:hypothetical protein
MREIGKYVRVINTLWKLYLLLNKELLIIKLLRKYHLWLTLRLVIQNLTSLKLFKRWKRLPVTPFFFLIQKYKPKLRILFRKKLKLQKLIRTGACLYCLKKQLNIWKWKKIKAMIKFLINHFKIQKIWMFSQNKKLDITAPFFKKFKKIMIINTMI